MPDPIGSDNGLTNNRSRTDPPLYGMLWLLLPSLIVGICAAAAMICRLPTKVEINAIVSQVQFRTRGEAQQVVLDRADARSLGLSGFKSVGLSPEVVWIFDPAKYDVQRNSFPENGWRRLPSLSGKDLVLTPDGQTSNAAVTIEADKGGIDSPSLGHILTGRGTVILSAPEPRLLSLELRGGEQTGTVELPEEFMMVVNSCVKNGSPWPYPGGSVALRIRLSRGNPLLAYRAAPSGVIFQARLAQGNGAPLLDESGLAVDRVEFVRAGRLTPDPQTTLNGSGSIRFAGAQGVDPVSLSAKDLLKVSDLREFLLLDAALTKDDGLKVRLGGTAGGLFSGPTGDVQDRRLTLFDVAWHNPRLAALFTILVWLIPTLVAGRKFMKEQVNGAKPH